MGNEKRKIFLTGNYPIRGFKDDSIYVITDNFDGKRSEVITSKEDFEYPINSKENGTSNHVYLEMPLNSLISRLVEGNNGVIEDLRPK